MRHRILRTLRASGAPHDVLDLGKGAQRVLGPMIEPVDFLQRRFDRHYGLDEQRALVEARQKIGADAGREKERRHGQGEREHAYEPGVSHAGGEKRLVEVLDAPDEPDLSHLSSLSTA